MSEKNLVDYTKYRLKPKEELDEILSGVSCIFVVSCLKCYKEFQTTEESECRDFLSYL